MNLSAFKDCVAKISNLLGFREPYKSDHYNSPMTNGSKFLAFLQVTKGISFTHTNFFVEGF